MKTGSSVKTYFYYNLHIMQKSKSFRFVMGFMLALCIALPVFYAVSYWGEYTYALPSADTLYIANSDGLCWDFLSWLFPFLLVLPYGFSYINEAEYGINLYLQSRENRRAYYYGQMLACFVGTALVILIPFLLNIALNAILFPVNGNDYISSYQAYDWNWTATVMGESFFRDTIFYGYIFKSLAINHPLFYNLLYAVFAGVSSGIMGMFVYAISILVRKNRILVLILYFLFFQVFTVFDRLMEDIEIIPVYINLRITSYLSYGHLSYGEVYPLFLLFLLAETIASFRIVKQQIKRDEW